MSLHGNWVKFKGIEKVRGFNRHHITINHIGQIHIGRQMHVDLGRPKSVTLYFEPTLNKIAVEPADPKNPGSIPLIAKTFGAYYIPGSQFIRQNRIHIAGTESFLKPELNHNGILILDLNETIRVTRGRNPGHGWKPDPREKFGER
ncbi:MAG TPA: hypothetical protein PLL77_06080 [Pyrinomonadaceae bacterium]|nr:hypothetical protein [Pyrinomonadaceae bacterium]